MEAVTEAVVDGHEDAFKRDPEVRQARMIAQAARSRLLDCLAGGGHGEVIDLTEAQQMLDALRTAQLLAADLEDRQLLRRDLLTEAEADKRSATRRAALRGSPATAPAPAPATTAPPGDTGDCPPREFAPPACGTAACVLARVLVPAAAGAAGAILARRMRRR